MIALFRLLLPKILIKLAFPALVALILCLTLGSQKVWPTILFPTAWILAIYSQYLSRSYFSRNLNWILLLPISRLKLSVFAVFLNLISAALAAFLSAVLFFTAKFWCAGSYNNSDWAADPKDLSELISYLTRPDVVSSSYIFIAVIYSLIFWPTSSGSAREGVLRFAKFFVGFLVLLGLLLHFAIIQNLGSAYFSIVTLFAASLMLTLSMAKLWQVHSDTRKKWLTFAGIFSLAGTAAFFIYGVWSINFASDSRKYWALYSWRIPGIVLSESQLAKTLTSDLEIDAWKHATNQFDRRYGFEKRPSLSEILKKTDPRIIAEISTSYRSRRMPINDLIAYSEAQINSGDDRSKLYDALHWAHSDFSGQDIQNLISSPNSFLRLVGVSHLLLIQKYEQFEEAAKNWQPGIYPEIDPMISSAREFSAAWLANGSQRIPDDFHCVRELDELAGKSIPLNEVTISYCLKKMAGRNLLKKDDKTKAWRSPRIGWSEFNAWALSNFLTLQEASRWKSAHQPEKPGRFKWAEELYAMRPDPFTSKPSSRQTSQKTLQKSRRRGEACGWADGFDAGAIATASAYAISPWLAPIYPIILMQSEELGEQRHIVH